VTAPRWIAEALDALVLTDDVVTMLPGESATLNGRYRLLPEAIETAARALIERLPVEAMAKAGCEAVIAHHAQPMTNPGIHGAAIAMVTRMISVLADGDPEVVELTELYQGAVKVLNEVGVPYAVDERRDDTGLSGPMRTGQLHLDLAARVRWLAQQRPTRLDLQRVEAECKALREDVTFVTAERGRLAGQIRAATIALDAFQVPRHIVPLDVAERDSPPSVALDLDGRVRELGNTLARTRHELATERSAMRQVGEARDMYRTERDAARREIDALQERLLKAETERDALRSLRG